MCVKHGGGAPQVQNKARERLAALVDPSLARLAKLIDSDNEPVALGAVKDALDRNGYKPKDHLHLEGDLPVIFTLNLGNPRVTST